MYRNGTAHLSLCVESVTKPSGTIQVLKGFLYNNGTAAACDVRLRAVNAPGVVELWPEWGPSASYELFFNPKQVTSVGMTLKPNADGSLPSVEVYSFHTCGEEGRNTNLIVQKEPMTCVQQCLQRVEHEEGLGGRGLHASTPSVILNQTLHAPHYFAAPWSCPRPRCRCRPCSTGALPRRPSSPTSSRTG